MTTRESDPSKYVPEDLIIKILVRLPIKSLLRFRLVSKSWLRLISGPQFKRTYKETSTCRQRLMILPWSGAELAITCPFRPKFGEHPPIDILETPFDFSLGYNPYEPAELVGSCNGLVCLFFPLTLLVVVWNPTIRKYRHLPASSEDNLMISCGFGYDECSDDYKVVEYSDRIGRRSCCSVYSLRTNSWKTSDWPHLLNIQSRCAVFVHGAFHWLVAGSDRPTYIIAVVNFKTEGYSRVPLPPALRLSCREWVEKGMLGVSRERLCLCVRNGKICWSVWVMQEYGVKESWISTPSIPYKFRLRNLCQDPEEEHLRFTDEAHVLVSIDSKCKSVSQLKSLRRLSRNFPDKATIYAESFFDPSVVDPDATENRR